MFGRVVNVEERKLGSTLSVPAQPLGYIGTLGSAYALSGTTLTVPVTVDQAGDSMIVAGGNDPNFVPSSMTDSRGNSYHIGPRAHAGGGGPDVISTTGLNSTVWIAHASADVAPLQAGDSVFITYGTSQSEMGACVMDCGGVGDIASDDPPSMGTDFGLIATRPSFNPPVDDSSTITNDFSLYVAAVYGSRHKQHVEPPLGVIVDDFGAPTINEGTAVAFLAGLERGMQVNMDTVDAGVAPSRNMSPGMGWAEGAVMAYNVTGPSSTSIFLHDTGDLDATGKLLIDPLGVRAGPYVYTLIDEDTGEVSIAGIITSRFDEGTEVWVYPQVIERWAQLNAYDDSDWEEGMLARVPHALFDKMPVGARDPDDEIGESVQAEFASDELVIVELTGQAPLVDASYLDPTTLSAVTDGYPPASPSPSPDVVLGDDHIKARWDAVTLNSNGDPQTEQVTYDVYIAANDDAETATLDSGTSDGEFLLTAVDDGAAGNDITLTITIL